MTRRTRTLGRSGPAAREALPALIHCGALDAAGPPVLVDLAVRSSGG